MSRRLCPHALVTVLYWMLYPIIIEGACPVGHYCPPEGGQIACPKGFYNPTPDSTDYTACLPCPGGQYCGTAGLSAPSGPCDPGWYCPGGNVTPQPTGKECWPNHYCSGGGAAPIMCAPGQYQPDSMQASCLSCPAGSYCLDGINMGSCDPGFYCGDSSSSPTETKCPIAHYCTGGVKKMCQPGTMQPHMRNEECRPCPTGKYCAEGGLTQFSNKCAFGWWCGLGATWKKPPGQTCPVGHRCSKGFKWKCGLGMFQNQGGQDACIACPPGHYCPSETTIEPIPCDEGECCHFFFYESKPCHQGDFLHLTYDASSRPTWDEANALCQEHGWYKPAVIDAQAEYDRMITWFLETSSYVINGNVALPAPVWLGGTWTNGSYSWDMTFQVTPMSWGNWMTGEDPTPTTQHCLILNQDLQFENTQCDAKMDVLCEKSSPCDPGMYYDEISVTCLMCPEKHYCKGGGLFEPTGLCRAGWYCREAVTMVPAGFQCSPGRFCIEGDTKTCPRSAYQSHQGHSTCELCPAGKFCGDGEVGGQQYPVGLCSPGYFCPAGSRTTEEDGIVCPIGHYCPAGSGAPTPCPGGRYQDQTGQGFCKICPEDMYCDTAEAIAEQQSGAGSPTHGVVTPKPCPTHIDCFFGSSLPTCEDDPYEAGAIDLLITCTPFCSGPVSSIYGPITFQVTCSNCGTSFDSYTWSVRKCLDSTVDQCVRCLRQQVNYIDDDHNLPSYTFDSMWLLFDITDWQYFSVMVKGKLISAEEGMAYKLWWYFEPWTGAVNCAITPTQGQPMDTVFSISCDPVPGEDQLTLDFTLSAYYEVLYQGSSPINNLQLPEADPADNFQLPLHLEASTNGGQTFYETDFTVEINPPVDGGYTDWTAWSTCTLTCATGSQTRTRDCTNPAPQYGGADCVGTSTQNQDCNTQNCPIDGGYTLWTAWDTCTVTCGTGSQARTRDCTNPVPQYGGANCVGASSGTQVCNTQNCPIDGGYTLWTAWDTCTVTCGTGSQARTRDCTDPVPQYGGANCVGASSGTQDCNTQNCPIDGGYTLWTAWDTCTVTCGTGNQARTRDCTNPVPQYGGANCVGPSSGTQACNTHNCPIDGGYTEWTAWGTCSHTCGTGSQTRTRHCTNPSPQYGGASCLGLALETQNCNTHNCPIDGGYTEWTVWDTCTVTCGVGSQTRTRDCTNPAPQYGGAACIGSSSATQDCSSNCPIDGGYTEWTVWNTCTVTCGTGTQDRTRDCTNPVPQYGGAHCVGLSTESQNCNTHNCPIDGGYTEWTDWDTCTLTCGSGSQTRTRDCTNPVPQYGGADCIGDATANQACITQACPIDGGYTEWTVWAVCSLSCETGSQARTRDCSNPAPQFGGADCVGTNTESQDCNTQNCPIDGGYTEWTLWDACTQTCGTGSRTRTRDCTNPVPQYGGANCAEASTESQDCITDPCPIDGGLTQWSVWDTCTKTCGSGTQHRSRSCTNPAPQYGGASCVGETTEMQACNTDVCVIDGGFSEWTAWGTCSYTCGRGTHTRSRSCTNPAPLNGGADCVGDAFESGDCLNICSVDGLFAEWSLWDTCTQTCNTGSQSRSRTCTDPAPEYGGADCVGDPEETQACNTNPCPVDGGWTEWTEWSSCTQTCGTGSQTRSHSCTNPAPAYGGAECLGLNTEALDCNTDPCPVWDPFIEGTIRIMLSCQPMCTNLMSSAHAILFDAFCVDCDKLVSRYEWTLRDCSSYSVDDCKHYDVEMYFVNRDSRNYKYHPTQPGYNIDGWTHLGIFVKATMADGNKGMAYHIWRFFDPATSPVTCSVSPSTGLAVSTLFSVTCENVDTPEPYNITYSLYSDPAYLVLLYKGATPNVNNLLLPAGYEDGQNNLYLHMVARIQGHYFYRAKTVVQVRPPDLTDESIEVSSQSISVIEQQIQQGDDILGAVLELENMAGFLNHASNMQDSIPLEDDNTTTDSTPLREFRAQLTKTVANITTDSYDLISSVSAVMKKLTERPDKLSQEARVNVYKLANIDTDSYNLVSSVLAVMKKLTERPDKLSQEAREMATEKYSNLAESLVQAVGNTDEDIPMEELTNTAGAILEGAGSMINLYIETMEEELAPRETEHNGTQTTPRPATQNMTKNVEMTEDLMKAIDRVCDALIDRQVQGMEATVVETDRIQIAVQKLSPLNFQGATIEVESPKDATKVSSVTLPKNLTVPSTARDLRLHVVVLEKNPHVQAPDASQAQVKTSVVSITLKDQDNKVVSLAELATPIRLAVPYEIDTATPQYLPMRLRINKQKDGLSIDADPSYTSKASFKFPARSSKMSGLKFSMSANFSSFLVYITNIMRQPQLGTILREGKLYPVQVPTYLEKFADYLEHHQNSSVLYFPQSSTSIRQKRGDYSWIYVGISLDLSNNDTIETLEILDPNCTGNLDLESCVGLVETTVEFRTFTLACMYWNAETQAWSDEGCWISPETTDSRLGCECDHLSLFGGSILHLPAEIDPLYGFLYVNINNPLAITVVLIVWMVYIFLAFWARKADERDRNKEGVILCSGSSLSDTHGYLVCVSTGWWRQAGSTASVFMYITGSLDVSPRTCLSFRDKDCLQNGSEDWFLLTLDHSLGHLQSVTLWHDNSGTSPHWFLNQAFVKDLQSGESWTFLCNDWLAVDRGLLRNTSVTMLTLTGDELKHRQKYHFFLKASEDLRDGHIWMSIFSKPTKSYFTRVQRLSCCLTILLTTMLADLMFYGIPTDLAEDQMSTDSFTLSPSQVAIGLKGSLVVFPINFAITQLFIRSKPQFQTQAPVKEQTDDKVDNKFDEMFWFNATGEFPFLIPRIAPCDVTLKDKVWWHLNFFPRYWVDREECDIKLSSYRSSLDSVGGQGVDDTSQRATMWAKTSSTDKKFALRPSDRRRILPWWCLYIAWSIVMTVCITCSFLVMLYGSKFGYTLGKEWLVSVLAGFVHSMLIQEPLKAIAMTVLLALVIKKNVQLEDVEPKLEEDPDENFEKGIAVNLKSKREKFRETFSTRLLHNIKESLRLKWFWEITIKDMAIQAAYLTLFLIIIGSQRPVNLAYLSSVTVKNLFVNNRARMPLHEVKTPANFFAYLHGTLIPGMAEVTAESRDEVTLGSNHYLIGSYRLRQLRVRNGTCISVIKSMIPDGCDLGYEGSVQDTEHHSPGWGPAPATIDNNSPWRHREPEELETMWLYGNHANYPGSGYVVNMAQDTGLHHDVFNSLETDGWIDERTRAAFVEFTLYNPGVDLFNIVIIMFEYTNLGRIFTDHRIFTTTMNRYLDDSQTFIMVCVFLYVVLNILFMCIQFVKYRTMGRRKFLAKCWNIVELVQILISFIAVGLFIYRFMIVERFFDDFKQGGSDQFINMSAIVLSNVYIKYVTTGLLSILMLKAIKLLQFHWRPRLIVKTLSHVKSHLFHFILLMFLVIAAYSHSAYLMFHNVLYSYRTFGQALMANLSIILGMADFADVSENSWCLGPLFFTTFIVSVNCCLATMYAAILNISRIQVKDSHKEHRDKLSLNEYIVNRVKKILHLKYLKSDC